MRKLCIMLKRPARKYAYLVFADPQAKRKKPKEPIFLPAPDGPIRK